MRRIWMGALAVVMTFALTAGGAAAAEKKAQASKQVKSAPAAEKKVQVPKDVRSTPTGKVLNETARGIRPAGNTFDGRAYKPPVQVDKSTSTRTPQQAIQDYKKSGDRPGPKTLKTKPVPAPR